MLRLDNLKMPCFNTTLMGVIQGAADYFDRDLSPAMIFGGSGHAFLMNIHKDLCPSSPYCWNPEPFRRLLGNLGFVIIDLGFYTAGSTREDRARIETVIKENLRNGIPCAVLNMENQLILGYDDTGFILDQPWAPKVDFPPGHLTFGDWREWKDEIHAGFYKLHIKEPAGHAQTILDSFEYAVDIYENPTEYTRKPYAAGKSAYKNWIAAVSKGHGSSHGSWWNAMVWSECRAMAAEYFREIAADYPSLKDICLKIAGIYGPVADKLAQVADRNMADDVKTKMLCETRRLETRVMKHLKAASEILKGLKIL